MSVTLSDNPLRKGLAKEKATDPCVFVIFGGTGDLSRRKLLPALYHLHLGNLLPRGFAIVIYASSDLPDDLCKESVSEWIKKAIPRAPLEDQKWNEFISMVHCVRRVQGKEESFTVLKNAVEEIDNSIGAEHNYIFYLAIPPSAFAETARGLAEVGLASKDTKSGWQRIIVEKPFGTDLASARQLNQDLLEVFDEQDIFRIDHYLGKETVQNILVFRFANEFIEPLLNAEHVDHIQITVAETLGLEGRGGYYDSSGAMRDMMANHMLQVLALTCMEPPDSMQAEAVRDAKVALLKSIRSIDPEHINDVSVRGQYSSGRFMGSDVPGYREEPDVAPDSKTDSYAALKLNIDNPRWQGTPVYMRTGKRLAKKVTEVGIQLKSNAKKYFQAQNIAPNVISINIQPNEGIAVKFEAKVPGFGTRIQPVRMDFRYGTAFGHGVPEAYERLLLDSMLGDHSLFPRADGVEAAWAVVDPILKAWGEKDVPLYNYTPGSWGPEAASELIERDGRKWRRL